MSTKKNIVSPSDGRRLMWLLQDEKVNHSACTTHGEMLDCKDTDIEPYLEQPIIYGTLGKKRKY